MGSLKPQRDLLIPYDNGGILEKFKLNSFVYSILKTSLKTILVMNTLEADILRLQELAESTGVQSYLNTLVNKKTQLADLLGFKTQGALVRSRFLSVNQMDAPSRFFLT